MEAFIYLKVMCPDWQLTIEFTRQFFPQIIKCLKFFKDIKNAEALSYTLSQ